MNFVIGDIHGGAKTFDALLDTLRLSHFYTYYLLGDYVDRGPDSKGVLDIIMQLIASGYDVRPLMGNHEEMMLKCITDPHDDFSRHWFTDWGHSFGIQDPSEVPDKYINFLQKLPLFIEEYEYILVHAGLAFDAPNPLTDSQPHHMLWQDSGVPDRRKLGGKVVVTGHIIEPIQSIMRSLNSDRIYLDNGAFTENLPDFGNLVALNLDTKALILQPWIDHEICC